MPSKAALTARTGPAWQPDALIRTKLYIPQVRPKRVPRRALLARLEAGLTRKLTLIAAPAGFGKTVLLREWRSAMTARRSCGCRRTVPMQVRWARPAM